MASKPVVGLTVTRGRDKSHPKNQFYIACLEDAGAEVVILRPDMAEGWHDIARALDALVLGGGGDVHPRRYGQALNGSYEHSIDEARDSLEISLIQDCLARDVPILGICRGIQVLNVALGGSLRQHLPGHRSHNGNSPITHPVRVRPGSRLWYALGCRDELIVNSHHHQGITPPDLAPSLIATAWAVPDADIVEGVESLNHRWVVGVQWHPERVHEFPASSQEAQRLLFRALVRAARREPVPT